FYEPAMSHEQALSYLVLGRPMSTGEDSNMLGEAALLLLTIGNRVRQGLAELAASRRGSDGQA
ncbi:CDP-alcohol phosphatidyltransferase family protein, partial [Pseudomonas aeruginosa]